MKILFILFLAIFCQSCRITNIEPDEESNTRTAQNDSINKSPSPSIHGEINDWETDSTEYVTHAQSTLH